MLEMEYSGFGGQYHAYWVTSTSAGKVLAVQDKQHALLFQSQFSAANLALAGFPLTNALSENMPTRH